MAGIVIRLMKKRNIGDNMTVILCSAREYVERHIFLQILKAKFSLTREVICLFFVFLGVFIILSLLGIFVYFIFYITCLQLSNMKQKTKVQNAIFKKQKEELLKQYSEKEEEKYD